MANDLASLRDAVLQLGRFGSPYDGLGIISKSDGDYLSRREVLSVLGGTDYPWAQTFCKHNRVLRECERCTTIDALLDANDLLRDENGWLKDQLRSEATPKAPAGVSEQPPVSE
jgi:hypothetical protein